MTSYVCRIRMIYIITLSYFIPTSVLCIMYEVEQQMAEMRL